MLSVRPVENHTETEQIRPGRKQRISKPKEPVKEAT